MKRGWKIFIGLVVSLVLLFIFRAPLLTAYARFFTVNTARPGADAMVVLAGSMKNRLTATVHAVHAGYAKKVLITDVRLETELYPEIIKGWTFIADTIFSLEKIEHVLVPSLKGPVGKGATSTFDEAYDIAEYCRVNNLKRIIILTDDFHTRRARYCFRKVFRKMKVETEIETMGCSNAVFNEKNWWTTEDGLQQYVLEPIKYSIYLLRSRNLSGIKEG